MSLIQYNEGDIYKQMIDLSMLFKFLNQENVELLENADKLSSLFKKVGDFEILTHIGSCAIKPRFGRWKKKNRLKYCKDINRSVNLSLELSGFFLSNFGLRFPNLGIFLQSLSQTTTSKEELDQQKQSQNINEES